MNIANILFLLVIASLPIQLNKFFFPDFSFVLGIPIDYRAIAIYFSHLAIVLYLISFLYSHRSQLKHHITRYRYFALTLAIFNLYLLAAQIAGAGQIAVLWFPAKIAIFSLFCLFAASSFNNRKIKKPLTFTLTISLLWQSILIIGQFISQHSLGLWLLGERTFDAQTFAIAQIQIAGTQLLRPYGTFPHPNVAAAYLVLILLILANQWANRKLTPLKVLTLSLGVVAIILTFSKTALLILFLAIISFSKISKNFFALILLVALIIFVAARILIDANVASIAERLVLTAAALDITLINPLFGVGSANFILELSKLDLTSLSQTRLLQPVHNVFLLILAENGLLGLLLFTLLLYSVSKFLTTPFKNLLFFALLIFASADHFLWTLHQGQMIFWLTIGYIVSKQKK